MLSPTIDIGSLYWLASSIWWPQLWGTHHQGAKSVQIQWAGEDLRRGLHSACVCCITQINAVAGTGIRMASCHS